MTHVIDDIEFDDEKGANAYRELMALVGEQVNTQWDAMDNAEGDFEHDDVDFALAASNDTGFSDNENPLQALVF